MMIAASEPQEFVPFGRQQLLIHPKVVHASERLNHESILSNKFSEVFISDTGNVQENWILRPTMHDGIECEEELYFKEKTVVWSIGPASVDNRTNRVLKCCYTSESPIQDALWCNFSRSIPDFPSNFFNVPPSKSLPDMSPNSQEAEHIENCICILNTSVIKFFTPTGREFMTPLQFQIKKMWPIKYGLLLERKVNREAANQQPGPTKKKTSIDLRRQSIEQSYLQKSSFTFGAFSKIVGHETFTPPEPTSSELPTIFSLNHPLEEICPISSKNENGSYVSNPDLKIIFTSESPSLCFTLDRKTGFHALYLLRKAQSHESELCWKRETRPSHRNSYASFGKLSGSASSINLEPENRSLPFLSARTRKSLGLGGATFPNVHSSPYASFEPRTSSPLPFRPHTSSSPLFGGFSHYSPNSRKTESSQASGVSSPSRFDSRLMSEDAGNDDARPLFPQICLQCVWVETQDLKAGADPNIKASKAFLSEDILGQQYFCYLVQLKLHLLRLHVKGDEDVTIGSDVAFIQAKDAAPLKSRNMIAVLSLDGGVELFTGNVHIAKILISGVSSSVATPSYLSDFNAGPIFFSKPSPNAFPKRSSLVPQTAPHESPIFNDSLSQFSPVTCSGLSPTLPISREGTLLSIKDCVGSRLSLEYSSSLIFRLDLPHFGNSSLVDSIVDGFRYVLPPATILQFLIKWYCTRNAPGCYNVSLEEEFNMFSNILYSSLGYDVEKLKGDQLDQTSPVTRPKKQRTSESQTDDDWSALITSQHHALASKQLHPLQLTGLQLRPCDVSSSLTETPMISGRSSVKPKDITSTPISTDKYKRVSAGRKDKLECIDETPMHPKSFGKARIPSIRFPKALEKGDSTPVVTEFVREELTNTSALCNKKAILYPHFSTIFFTLHLLYEELKLNILRTKELEKLVPILFQFAKDAGCKSFIHHYWTDYPNLCRLVANQNTMPNLDPVFTKAAPSIFSHLHNILQKKPDISPYQTLKDLNKRSKYISEVFGLMSYENENVERIFKNVTHEISTNDDCVASQTPSFPLSADSSHRVVLHLTKTGVTTETLKTLPPGVVFTIYEALYRCRDNPRPDLGVDAYKMIERNDLASLCRSHSDSKNSKPTNKIANRRKSTAIQPENEAYEADGMYELTEMDTMKLRWSTDQRVIELRRMLQSAFPVRFSIQQRPEVSDHDFLQEQERHLYAICARTMALPVARGMVTLSCGSPVITEQLPIPALCLAGKVPPNDKLVDMSHIEVPSNMNDWPYFHNGVAAGLLISPNTPNINAQWIMYNKPKASVEQLTEHAGFLMALGLNGHLKDLTDLTVFSYLGKTHEFTKVGLMLGIAISKRGTMDPAVVRMISVHTEAMLPPTGIEIELDVIVVPTAIMSLGFLYQGTAHRHITQVLLQEIGRPPGPEMENSVDRESYSLAAGLALGLVVFGKGDSLSGFADAEIPNSLHHYMVGGPKRPYLGSQRDKYKTPSFLIFEGPLVNTHVTGPGATLALGMMYFDTGNKAVAEWLKVPETQHLLETVLPDALLLRTLTKSLILWRDIVPSQEWVLGHVPAFVLPHCLVKPDAQTDSDDIDYETMNQAYCNIVAGACMAIGLRFAGSADVDAFNTLSYFAMKFTMLFSRTIADLCGRATLETCLNVITVSLGMVMAGTGNLKVMRLCRHLRSRVGPNNPVVTYGSHLATHMALGLLFLGGGTLSLSSSPSAVAALLCAFYPKWPVCSSDNRYHLQALRHLYVLAVEPRLFLPRDIETRTLCYAYVTYVYINNCRYDGETVKLLAPCLLPELHLLKEVRIEDDRYWSIVFKEGENWDELLKVLGNNSFVDVKRRSGCLSYVDDPQGFRSLLGQTLTSDKTIPWGVRPPSVCLFSSNPTVENFLNYFFDSNKSNNCTEVERKTLTAMAHFTYFCLTKDKMSLLPHWLSLIQLAQSLSTHPNVNAIWQWKLIFSQAQKSNHQLMPPDVALSVKQDISSLLSSWEPGVLVQIKDYLVGNLNNEWQDYGKVATYLTFHEISYRDDINYSSLLSGDIPSSLLKMAASGFSSTAILSILSLLQY